jgi:NADP-dependent aldehyde dehydrogenase
MGAAFDGTAGFTLLDAGIAGRYRSGVAALASHEAVAQVAAGAQQGRTVAATLLSLDAEALDHATTQECFGPTALVARYGTDADLPALLSRLEPSLTTTLQHATGEPVADDNALSRQSGRVVFQRVPTGVAVTWAMTHGGPWPATTSQYTSVGASAIRRFLRPVTFQNAPADVLPQELRDARRGHAHDPDAHDGTLVLPATAG